MLADGLSQNLDVKLCSILAAPSESDGAGLTI